MCLDKTSEEQFEIPRGPETSQQAGPRHLKEMLETRSFVTEEETLVLFDSVSTDLDAIYGRLENIEIENDHLLQKNKMLNSIVKHLDNKVNKLTTVVGATVFYLIVWLIGWGFGWW